MDRQAKIIQTFNDFTGKNLDILDSFYSEHIQFCDPVRKVSGFDSLKKYYSEIYENVDSIQFQFNRFVEDKNVVFAEWTMTIQVKGLHSKKPYPVNGCSLFEFDRKNLVHYHRDYFDLGEMVYEKIPLLGSLVRTIKEKL